MPPVGRFESALLVARGAGEGPLHVAEQLALQHPLGQCRAVHGHERPVGPRAEVVDGPGDQFLARAALALDQHRGVGVGHLLDQLEDLPHRLALADHIVEPILPGDVGAELDQLGGVAEDDHAVLGLSGPMLEHGGANGQHLLFAAGRLETRQHIVDGAALADRFADGVGRFAELFAEHALAGAAQGLLLVEFEDVAGGPIDGDHPALGVKRDDPLDQAVENGLQVVAAESA